MLESYLETYRPLLVASSSSKKKNSDHHDFVFVTRHGTPFTASYFSDFLSSLLFHHTGQRVATNILRSSFVTHFYSSDEAQDPVMRESVATVMRHSVDQALRVYDRSSSSLPASNSSHRHTSLLFLMSMTRTRREVLSLLGPKKTAHRPWSSSSAVLIRSFARWRRMATACCSSARWRVPFRPTSLSTC